MRSFPGGTHPPERKMVAHDSLVQPVLPSSNMVWIPVTQGGRPNQPLVKVGDKVARGQKIAESSEFMSAPVHSSVSGTVKKLEPHLVTGNSDVPCFVIQIDKDEREEFLEPLDPFHCTKEEALARVKEAGIAGMGGASFPAHVKLNPPKGTKIEYVIANGAECEPYLCADAAAMFRYADDIAEGLAITMHITGAHTGIILIEDNKHFLKGELDRALSKQGSLHSTQTFELKIAPTKYPQGGEKNITLAAVGREIPAGGLPAHIGCVVQNVATLRAIAEAFNLGKPLIDRSLTISGGAVVKPINIVAPIGTRVSDLIPQHIALKDGVMKIISGGPMMGFAMKSPEFPIQKNTSGVLFLTKDEVNTEEETSCIGCARCLSVCSCQISPVLIVRSLKANDMDKALYYGLMDCVECGACAYICPARIKLVQHFKIGKAKFRAESQKKAARAAALQAKEGK